MKKDYTIYINGCDDSTVIKLSLTEQEFTTIKNLADMSESASTYGCMPTIELKEGDNDN